MAEEEDLSNLPLADRFAHKNWKVRKEAYEAATKEFKTAQESDPIVRDFTHDAGLWKGAVADSNVAAQQEALAALCAFLDIAGTSGCTRTRNHTITPIVEKGLTGRPAAKQSALEALMLYIELDRSEPVIEELLPLLAHKQPKIIAATLSAMTSIVHAYGVKIVEPKSVLKILPKAYGHADKGVRTEAQNLTVELYRWLKEAMKPLFWNELKPVQQQDLEKLFEKVKDEPAPKQERLLRSQQAIEEAPEVVGEQEPVDGGDEEEAEVDLEPELLAIDVFPKIPKDFHDRLASSKWKDRKDALDELHAAVNVPAIEEGQFNEIVHGLAKSMKDANVAVVTVAANCVECLAKGLRRPFSKYRSTILSPMLERFKEKKQTVIDSLAAACDATFASTTLSDLLEELLGFFTHKNPQVKLESTRFLIRCLKTTRDVPQPPEVKSMAEAGIKHLSDAQAVQRDAGAEVLGVLWKIMGDRNMLAHLEGLDEIRKTKIKEFCEQADVKAKWKPKAAPAPKPAAAAPQKKGPPGKRPTAGVKKAAPPAPRPYSPLEEPASPAAAPLAARPTSRPASKLTSAKPGLAVGHKKPALAKPGLSGSVASPRRQATASPSYEDSQPAPPQSRGLPTPGRGLAARPLGKPIESTASAPAPAFSHSPASTLSSAERAELSDLRAESDLLRQQNSDLRTDKLRLQSQIHELQNQNAQLIEDHTRDVLSVKAKETQLVRARSDCSEAEDRVEGLGREVEKLKREIQRLGRQGQDQRDAYADHASGYGIGNGGGDDTGNTPSNGANGRYDSGHHAPGYGTASRPTYTSKSYSIPSTLSHGYRRENGVAGARPGVGEGVVERDGEGKENIPDAALSGVGYEKRLRNPAAGAGSAKPSPAVSASVLDGVNGGSGRSSPGAGQLAPGGGGARGASTAASSRGSSMNRSQSDGVESWRRAAEVTQNLKARIEMMKAKQNMTRGH